nr:zinc ribbon domain-containing protein [uncultured Oscillibacter sp.]
MSIFCVACGAELPEGAGFCPHCGTKVVIPRCPACGKELDFGVSFCMYCGQQLKKDDTETGSENEEASVENCGLKSAFEADRIPSEEISSAIPGESSDSSTDTEQNIVGSEMAPSFLWSYQKGLQAPIVTTVDVLDDRIHIREARKSSKAEFIRQDRAFLKFGNLHAIRLYKASGTIGTI